MLAGKVTSGRKGLGFIAKALLTIAFFVYLMEQVEWADVFQVMATISPWWAFAAVLWKLLQYPMAAFRWRIFVNAIGGHIRFLQALSIFWIGFFAALFLPGMIGGDVVRVLKIREAGVSLRIAASSVILERGVMVASLFLMVSVISLVPGAPRIPGIEVFWFVTIGGLVGGLLLTLLPATVLARLMQRKMLVWLGGIIEDMLRILRAPGTAMLALALSIFGNSLVVIEVYLLGLAIGTDITVLACFALVPPVILVVSLPISIGGWGAREVALVTALAIVGIPAENALVISVLFGLLTTLLALPGGLLWVLAAPRRKVAI
ncbi:flippase-like domain-containing protein [Ferrovibrio terrae]|uniref:Flippase-like domain-containing protein n=1 Tax=Ferrovibrio terrae TaxID=2594003 RepID=A0A516GXY4_9PROT|nr:lysylphosphatidylglycerol synthase transmembrane domain-containing protein [Ferrovibrio terrae]QDO96357.1 flippase-like domain-containing protein [Ferrovibrio terrae]